MLVNKKFENSSNIIVNRWLLTGYLLISCSGGYSDRKIRFFYPPLRAFITKVTPWHIFPDWHKPGNNYVSTQLSQNKAKYWRSVWKFWNETSFCGLSSYLLSRAIEQIIVIVLSVLYRLYSEAGIFSSIQRLKRMKLDHFYATHFFFCQTIGSRNIDKHQKR